VELYLHSPCIPLRRGQEKDVALPFNVDEGEEEVSPARCATRKRIFRNWQWRTQEYFFGGGSTNLVEDRGQREWGSGGGSPTVRGSGGSCNFVQEISFHILKFS
jgi:hypothetical protein